MAIKMTQYVEWLLGDAFPAAGFDAVDVKRMFGGYSFYIDGQIFAAIMQDDLLFIKAPKGSDFAKTLDEKDYYQFIYSGHKSREPAPMPYYRLPEEVVEDPDQLREVIDAALAALR